MADDDTPPAVDDTPPAADAAPTESSLPEMPTAAAEAPRRSVRRRVGIAVAAVVLLAAGAITVTALVNGSGGGGAKDPEEAARRLVESVERGDALGALEILDPAEREVVRNALTAADTEVKRLQLLSDSFSLAHVAGV